VSRTIQCVDGVCGPSIQDSERDQVWASDFFRSSEGGKGVTYLGSRSEVAGWNLLKACIQMGAAPIWPAAPVHQGLTPARAHLQARVILQTFSQLDNLIFRRSCEDGCLRKVKTLTRSVAEIRSAYLVGSGVAKSRQSGRSVPWKTILDLDSLVIWPLGISATRVAFGPSSVFSILGPSVFHWGRQSVVGPQWIFIWSS
jgi:hypothetical protein